MSQISLKRIRVIYLDDDKQLSAVLTDFLSTLGLEVSPFYDQQEAFNEMSLNGHKYELALIDYMMPLKNGVEFLREMAEHNFFDIKYNALYSSIASSELVDRSFKKEKLENFPIFRISKATDDTDDLLLLLNKIRREML